jgi:hypothetical protein
MGIVFSCSWPVLWLDPDGKEEEIGGTCFFVHSGSRLFGMSAWHVLSPRSDGRACRLPNTHIDPSRRVISFNADRDVATFDINEREVMQIGKVWTTPVDWPPKLPEKGRGVFFGGYRKRDRKRLKDGTYDCGFAGALTTAEEVNGDRIVVNLDRVGEVAQRTYRPIERGEDWGGASGGPLFAVVADAVDSWRLVGVLSQGVGTWENFVFCTISKVRADGTIKSPPGESLL